MTFQGLAGLLIGADQDLVEALTTEWIFVIFQSSNSQLCH